MTASFTVGLLPLHLSPLERVFPDMRGRLLRFADTIEQEMVGRLPVMRVAAELSRMRVGLVGDPFPGMGDFQVTPAELKACVGPQTIALQPQELQGLIPPADDRGVQTEISADLEWFNSQDLDQKLHRDTVRVGMAFRRWIEEQNLGAFSINPLCLAKALDPDVLPFLECSKAMARGIGYAGEGDVLTASLLGRLMSWEVTIV